MKGKGDVGRQGPQGGMRRWCNSLKFSRSNARTVRYLANYVCCPPNGRPWRVAIGMASVDPKRPFTGVFVWEAKVYPSGLPG